MKNRWMLGAVTAAALALAAATTTAQEVGDPVEVTLKSGKTFKGELAEAGDDAIKLKMGSTSIDLPRSMIASIEKVEAPAPKPAPEAAPVDPAPKPADAGAGDGPPRPNNVLLENGRVVEGYVIHKGGGKVYIVRGDVIEIDATMVDTIFGEMFTPGGGSMMSGTPAERARQAVEQLGSTDNAIAKSAEGMLDAMGADAFDAVVEGLHASNTRIRQRCLTILARFRPEGRPLESVLEMLREEQDVAIRRRVASELAAWTGEGVTRALLETAWRDRDANVRERAMMSVRNQATVVDTQALMDLLFVSSDGEAKGFRENLFGALRKATGKKYGDNPDLWQRWWLDEGGREDTAEQVTEIERQKIEERSRNL